MGIGNSKFPLDQTMIVILRKIYILMVDKYRQTKNININRIHMMTDFEYKSRK